jgi:hypothetical protein
MSPDPDRGVRSRSGCRFCEEKAPFFWLLFLPVFRLPRLSMYRGILLLLDDSQSTLSLNKLFVIFVRARFAATTFSAAIGLAEPVGIGDPADCWY